MSALVIDDNAEITFAADESSDTIADRVRLLANGYCHALITQGYQQKFYPPREIERVHDAGADEPEAEDEYRIDHGAEVWFTGDLDPRPCDVAVLLPGGWLALWSAGYGTDYWPAHMIDSVHTHTSDEQESAGWF